MEAKNLTLCDTMQSLVVDTVGLRLDLNLVIKKLKELDTIKEKQLEIAERYSSLLMKTKDKVKTWASLCNLAIFAPLSSVERWFKGRWTTNV